MDMTSTQKEIHETRLLIKLNEMLPPERQVAAYIAELQLKLGRLVEAQVAAMLGPRALKLLTDDGMPRERTRKTKIADEVEHIDLALWADEEYRKYFRATRNEHAVEGSLICDRFLALQMIREEAAKTGCWIAQEKTVTIDKALNVVLRRYGMSIKERRRQLAESTQEAGNG